MIETLLQAERLLIHGQVDQAEQIYAAAVQQDPNNSIAMVGLARVALERGDERLALERARAALAIDPQNEAAVRLESRLAEVMSLRGDESAPVPVPAPTPRLAHPRQPFSRATPRWPNISAWTSPDQPKRRRPTTISRRPNGRRLRRSSARVSCAGCSGAERGSMRILVTGGAGYVGSTTTERLIQAGHDVVVLDSLFRGYRAAVPPEARLVVGDLGDAPLVERTLREHAIDAVLHCAGRALVGEIGQPAGALLPRQPRRRPAHARRDARGRRAAHRLLVECRRVWRARNDTDRGGPPDAAGQPVRRDEARLRGHARLVCPAHDLAAVSLRYFNVAGAIATARSARTTGPRRT